MKKSETFIRALEVLGFHEEKSPSKKYRKFVREGYLPIWIGKYGALRMGKNSSDSIALSEGMKELLIRKSGISIN